MAGGDGMSEEYIALKYCPICKRVESGGLIIHGYKCPKNKTIANYWDDLPWKQAAKSWRENYILAVQMLRITEATATRRKELLREALYFLEYVPVGIEGKEDRYHKLMSELAKALVSDQKEEELADESRR